MGDKPVTDEEALQIAIMEAANRKFDFANKEIRSVTPLSDCDGSGKQRYRVELVVSHSEKERQELVKEDDPAGAEEKLAFLDGGFEVTAVFDGEDFHDAQWKGVDFCS
jgi:hypothetical protein